MPSADLFTEDEIVQRVHGFYDRVRKDEVLGPVFNCHVMDGDKHLPKMVDFWSSALRGTARFHVAPMPKYASLAERAKDLAKRIAQSLWYGYQMKQGTRLPAGEPA